MMRERIGWSFSIWLIALFFNLLLAITLWGVLDTAPTLFLASLSLLATLVAAQRNKFEIALDVNTLRVGPAEIDRKFLGKATPLDRTEWRLERGYKLNPAAFLALRSWISTGVKIEINDPQDPTPYWLVSTKKPNELATLINKRGT
jgi:hypothetical protein